MGRAQANPPFQLPQAIERFKAYVQDGRLEELRGAFKQRHISQSTLRIWVSHPEKIAKSYKRFEFFEAIGTLPDLNWKKRNEAYEFGLKELGVGIDSQHELTSYDGAYRFAHDFHEIKLQSFVIRVEQSPFAAMFVFRYHNKDKQRETCDGLVVSRHGRMVCAGFSPTTMFHAVFRMGGNPAKDVLRGIAFIEDVNSEQVCFSTVAMTREATSLKEAEKMVRGSGGVL